MSPPLTLIDPLSLIGGELRRRLAEAPDLLGGLRCFHTAADEEVQIAEVGREPMLAPPLEKIEDLEDSRLVVVVSDAAGPRFGILTEALQRNPDLEVLQVGSARLAVGDLLPVARATAVLPPVRLRVAHPCLVAAAAVLDPLEHLRPTAVSLGVLEPVSVFGREALEALSHQAVARLQGENPAETIEHQALAFSASVMDADDLASEAAAVLAGYHPSVSRLLGGHFHGHMAHIGISFTEPVDERELVEAWAQDEGLEVRMPPASLQSVIDSSRIAVSRPVVSADGRHAAAVLMTDGLLIGGAMTALEILRALD